jgi:hypothetical protein
MVRESWLKTCAEPKGSVRQEQSKKSMLCEGAEAAIGALRIRVQINKKLGFRKRLA